MSLLDDVRTPEGLVADPPDTSQLPEGAQILLMATGKWVAQSLYAAAKLGLADHLADGPLMVEDLAERTGTHPPSLRRVLRAIASVGVFAEDVTGRYGQTTLSEVLRSEVPGSLRDAVIFFGEDFTWRPYGAILQTLRTGRPAFAELNDVPDIFSWFSQHPESQDIFDRAMLALSGDSIKNLTRQFDVSTLGTVIDVGGGQGFLLAEILRTNPSSRAVLFDRASVLPGAAQVFEEAGVADRVRTVAGDFFESVPGGGDTYILKSVLHDWTDDQSVDILRNISTAIGDNPNGRLLIIESVLPALNAWGFAKFMDIEMMVNVGGMERTEAGWREVFHRAGFDLVEQVSLDPPNSVLIGVPR